MTRRVLRELDSGEAAAPLARALRDSRASLTYRWLERIEDRVSIEAGQVFPTEEMLNHVPLLIDAIAEYVEDPAEEGTAADDVIAKASELGEMRHRQGFSAFHVLREFEILGGILLTFFRDEVASRHMRLGPDEALLVAHRLQRALFKVQQATAARYLALGDEERAARERRLRLVHEILADDLEPWLETRVETGATPEQMRELHDQIEDLVELSRPARSSRQQRRVPLGSVVAESCRRVRTIAQHRLVEVRVDEPLPEVEVNDAMVELCLVVLLTNALRYSARSADARWVEIRGVTDADAGEVVVEVRNTGSPVPRSVAFHELVGPGAGEPTVRDDEPGVGLRFVERSIQALGGRCWAEPTQDPPGSIFAFALPSRRSADAEAEA